MRARGSEGWAGRQETTRSRGDNRTPRLYGEGEGLAPEQAERGPVPHFLDLQCGLGKRGLSCTGQQKVACGGRQRWVSGVALVLQPRWALKLRGRWQVPTGADDPSLFEEIETCQQLNMHRHLHQSCFSLRSPVPSWPRCPPAGDRPLPGGGKLPPSSEGRAPTWKTSHW